MTTPRILTYGIPSALADDIRDHQYAIVQTRIERVPAGCRSNRCEEPDGCSRPATLATLAVAEVLENSNNTVGWRFARNAAGAISHIATCDDHRFQASHDLYYALTNRMRPDGIRAFDAPGQHLEWT